MRDNEKMLVVLYYPSSGGLSSLVEIASDLREHFDDTVITLTLPTTEENARLEVLNPKYISEKEYNKLVKKANKYLDKLNTEK